MLVCKFCEASLAQYIASVVKKPETKPNKQKTWGKIAKFLQYGSELESGKEKACFYDRPNFVIGFKLLFD